MIPAFLIPALTGFALSKLTGQSTKSSLRNALIGGLTGGITSGFGASEAGTAVMEQSKWSRKSCIRNR
jgi:VIT1/CCC1 family predicted Fe2+/Mn2+ transporter